MTWYENPRPKVPQLSIKRREGASRLREGFGPFVLGRRGRRAQGFRIWGSRGFRFRASGFGWKRNGFPSVHSLEAGLGFRV